MTIRLALLSGLLAVAAVAADVTGKWTAEVPGRGGNMQTQTISLKADGSNLTGTVSGRMGDTAITDGKIDGDTISFSVVREFQGNKIKINYTGKVSGDEINFKMQREGGEGQGAQFTAKRASTT